MAQDHFINISDYNPSYFKWDAAKDGMEIFADFLQPDGVDVCRIAELVKKAVENNKQDNLTAEQYHACLLQVMYNALEQMGISYVAQEFDFSGDQRMLLSPAALLSAERKKANTLELILLVLSCIKALRLDAALLQMDKHVFVGVWLENAPSSSRSFLSLEQAVKKLKFLPFEVTTLTDHRKISFQESVWIAVKNLKGIKKVIFIPAFQSLIPIEEKQMPIFKTENNISLQEEPAFIEALEKTIPLETLPKDVPEDVMEELISVKILEEIKADSVKECEKNIDIFFDDEDFFQEDELAEKTGGIFKSEDFFQKMNESLVQAEKDEFHKILRQWYLEIADFSTDNPLLSLTSSLQRLPLDMKNVDFVSNKKKYGNEFTLIFNGQSAEKSIFSKGKIFSSYDESMGYQYLNSMLAAERESFPKFKKGRIYLGLNQIEWTDSYSGQQHRAPVYLLPVTVESREHKDCKIKINWKNGILNETLVQFVKLFFHLNLDFLTPLDEKTYEMQLRQLKQCLASCASPCRLIVGAAELGFYRVPRLFAWDKMLSEDYVSDSILKKFVMEELEILSYCEDTIKLRLLPLKADSVQHHLVHQIAKEKITMVSGASGTGKTHLAATAAADAVYFEKKVLYTTSDKRQLDQFVDKISEAGVNGFCLRIDEETKITDLFTQMNAAFVEKNRYVTEESNEQDCMENTTEIYTQACGNLHAYYHALYTPAECGYSLAELIEMYEAYKKVETTLSWHDISINALKNKDSVKLIEQYASLCRQSRRVNELYQKKTDFTMEEKQKLKWLIKEAIAIFEEIEESCDGICELLQISLRNVSRKLKLQIMLSYAAELLKCKELNEKYRPVVLRLEKVELMDEDTKKWINTRKQMLKFLKLRAFSLSITQIEHIIMEVKSRPAGARMDKLLKILNEIMYSVPTSWIQVRKNEEFFAYTEDCMNKLYEYMKYAPRELEKFILENDKLMEQYGEIRNELEPYFYCLRKLKKFFVKESYGAEFEKFAEGIRELTFGVDFRLNVLASTISQRWKAYEEIQKQIEKLSPVKESFTVENPDMLKIDLFRIWLNPVEHTKEEDFEVLNRKLKQAHLGSVIQYFELNRTPPENMKDIFMKIWCKYNIRLIRSSNKELQTYEKGQLDERVNSLNQLEESGRRKVRQVLAKRVQSRFSAATSYVDTKAAIQGVFDAFPCIAMTSDRFADFAEYVKCKFDLVIIDKAEAFHMEESIPLLSVAEKVLLMCDEHLFISENATDTHRCSSESFGRQNLLSLPVFSEARWNELLWCYGDREKNRIALKNRYGWDEKIITLPSAQKSGMGIHYQVVNGACFEEDRINRLEAESIINEVIELYNCLPDQNSVSIGVIAMGYPQVQYLQSVFRRKSGQLVKKKYSAENYGIDFVEMQESAGLKWDYVFFSPVYGMNQMDELEFPDGYFNLLSKKMYALLETAEKDFRIVSGITWQMLQYIDDEDVEALKFFIDMAEKKISIPTESSYRNLIVLLKDALQQNGYSVQIEAGVASDSSSMIIAAGENLNGKLAVLFEGKSPTGYTFEECELHLPELLRQQGWKKIKKIRLLDWHDSAEREVETILHS